MFRTVLIQPEQGNRAAVGLLYSRFLTFAEGSSSISVRFKMFDEVQR